jgi:tetratricopeptide (TPR) repeat protein
MACVFRQFFQIVLLCAYWGSFCPPGDSFAAATIPGTADPGAAAVFEQELTSLRRSLAEKPSPALYLQLGKLLLRHGPLDEALSAFDEVLKRNPHSYEARVGKGAVLARLGQHEAAEMLLREALVNNPYPLQAHYELGLLYERRGALELAIEEYKKGLDKYHAGRH